MNQGAQILDFVNTGSTPCSLTGYPGIAALDRQGTQVRQASRGRSLFTGGLETTGTGLPVVSLAPGQSASARVGGDESTPTGARTMCTTYRRSS
jgi:hypothetical protein